MPSYEGEILNLRFDLEIILINLYRFLKCIKNEIKNPISTCAASIYVFHRIISVILNCINYIKQGHMQICCGDQINSFDYIENIEDFLYADLLIIQ